MIDYSKPVGWWCPDCTPEIEDGFIQHDCCDGVAIPVFAVIAEGARPATHGPRKGDVVFRARHQDAQGFWCWPDLVKVGSGAHKRPRMAFFAREPSDPMRLAEGKPWVFTGGKWPNELCGMADAVLWVAQGVRP